MGFWTKKYEADYPQDTAGFYPKYIDKNGLECEEKSPYFESMSKVLIERGYLFKKEFVSIGVWKTARQVNNYKANPEEKVQQVTAQMLKEHDEAKKVRLLTNGLKGVKIPVASAILTAVYPREFCVTDYRAWRALRWLQKVSNDGKLTFDSYKGYSDYIDFLDTYDTVQNYLWYLKGLRKLCSKENITPRTLEMALWKFDESKGQK